MTRLPLHPWAPALAVVVFLPGQARPQPNPAALHADSVASALARLKAGATLRLAARTGGAASVRGTLLGVQGDAVALQQGQQVTRLRLEQVTGVWVRGRHTKLGAILGGLAGLGAGLFLAAIVNSACEVDCTRVDKVYLVMGALGAGSGALPGALIGAAIPRWKRRFPVK